MRRLIPLCCWLLSLSAHADPATSQSSGFEGKSSADLSIGKDGAVMHTVNTGYQYLAMLNEAAPGSHDFYLIESRIESRHNTNAEDAVSEVQNVEGRSHDALSGLCERLLAGSRRPE